MASPQLSPIASEQFCEICGAMGATAQVTFNQNIGMVVARNTASKSGRMCKRCAWNYFKSYTLTTLFLGWWGMISLILTPIFLVMNVVNIFKARGLSDPIGAPQIQNVDPGAGNSKLKLLYGVVVVVVLVGVIAYNNVELVEKVSPALNEKIHSGEVSETSDAEYASRKYFQDVSVINAEFKSQEWKELRNEVLNRKASFEDLRFQNERLQAAMQKERIAGKQERCEQLALDELGPAMNDYAVATYQFYEVMQANTDPAADTSKKLDEIGDRQEASMQRIRDHLKKSKDSGCQN